MTSEYQRPYKQRRTYSQRQKDVEEIRETHPDQIPLIVEKYCKEKSLPQMDQIKFLVPKNLTMCELQGVIRRRLRLQSSKSLYLIVNNRSLVSNSTLLCEVYEREKDDDGFLYMVYASQEAFGQWLLPVPECPPSNCVGPFASCDPIRTICELRLIRTPISILFAAYAYVRQNCWILSNCSIVKYCVSAVYLA